MKTDIFSRVRGIFNTDVLLNKKIAVVGLGSVGSVVSLELAKSGVSNFILIDPDTFEINNVCRHIGDIEDIGRFKTQVVKERIIKRNPSANIQTIEKDLLQIEENVLKEALDSGYLIIAATDSKEANFYLNELSLELKIPLLWIGLYERASWGHIIYSIPGKTPCLACSVPLVSEIIEKVIPKEERIVDYSAVQDVTKVKAEPGLGMDVAFVTLAGAKIALSLLLRDSETSSFSKFLPPEKTMLIVANGPGSIFPDTKPLTISWVKTEVREDCDFCRRERYLEEFKMSDTELQEHVSKIVDEIPETEGGLK